MKRTTLVLAALALVLGGGPAGAGTILADSVDASANPGHISVWGATDAGWYYTPAASHDLVSMLTKFGSTDARTVTEVVYGTSTPSDGSTLLRSAIFVPVAGDFAGGDFAPLTLAAGSTYLVGFENVGGLSVNLTNDAGAPYLSDLRYDFNSPASPGTFTFSGSGYFIGQPILLEFIVSDVPAAVSDLPVTPAPAGLTLLGTGVASLLGYGWRRKKQAVVA